MFDVKLSKINSSDFIKTLKMFSAKNDCVFTSHEIWLYL